MSSVLMSFGWILPGGNLSGLSLVCGLAVKKALEAMQVAAVSLKWPNDVLLNGKKLCGILVEVTGQKVVIGIGINVHLGNQNDADQYPVETKLPWTDLHRSGYQLDYSDLVAELIMQLSHILEKFTADGFDSFREPWMHAHYFHRKPVKVSGVENAKGIVTGVDSNGGLILDVMGEPRVFYAGDVSMSPALEGN